MRDVCEFLMENYYSKYPIEGLTADILNQTLERFSNRLIVIHDRGRIVGVAVFVLLDDNQTWMVRDIKDIDIPRLVDMLESCGENLHFLIVATKGYKIIREGLRVAVKKHNPRTISWWNPTTTRFHNYKAK